jgi:hypothetical protein
MRRRRRCHRDRTARREEHRRRRWTTDRSPDDGSRIGAPSGAGLASDHRHDQNDAGATSTCAYRAVNFRTDVGTRSPRRARCG